MVYFLSYKLVMTWHQQDGQKGKRWELHSEKLIAWKNDIFLPPIFQNNLIIKTHLKKIVYYSKDSVIIFTLIELLEFLFCSGSFKAMAYSMTSGFVFLALWHSPFSRVLPDLTYQVANLFAGFRLFFVAKRDIQEVFRAVTTYLGK